MEDDPMGEDLAGNEAGFIPGLDFPSVAPPTASLTPISEQLDSGSIPVLLRSLQSAPALRSLSLDRLSTLIVKFGPKISEEDKREIFSVLQDKVLFNPTYWSVKILQWALGILKALTPQMRNSGSPSQLIDKCLGEPLVPEILDLITHALTKRHPSMDSDSDFESTSSYNPKALECFIQETVKVPFRDDQMEWIACYLGQGPHQDIIFQGIFQHLRSYLKSNVNPFFSPLSSETPWRTDSSLSVVVTHLVTKRGPLLSSVVIDILEKYAQTVLSPQGPPSKSEVAGRMELVVYTLITMSFASPSFAVETFEGFLRFLLSVDLLALIRAELRHQFSKFQTFDEGFDTPNEKQGVAPYIVSWVRSFIMLHDSILTQHGYLLFDLLQNLLVSLQGEQSGIHKKIFDLLIDIFSKDQDLVILHGGKVLQTFRRHLVLICARTLQILEGGKDLIPSPALPSILLLELLGTASEEEIALSILGYLFSHTGKSQKSKDLFLHLSAAFDKVHPDATSKTLASEIRKLQCFPYVENQIEILELVEHILTSGSCGANIKRAIAQGWKGLLDVWKRSAKISGEPRASEQVRTHTSLQFLVLSIIDRSVHEVKAGKLETYRFLDSLIGLLFQILDQQLLFNQPPVLFLLSRQLSVLASIVQRVCKASGQAEMLPFLFDLLLERALESQALRPTRSKNSLISGKRPVDLNGDVEMANTGDAVQGRGEKTPSPSVLSQQAKRARSEAVSETSLLGQNRARDLGNAHRKISNSIQKKILVHKGKLKPRPKNAKTTEDSSFPPLPSPFHELSDFTLHNDLVVQNISSFTEFLAALLKDDKKKVEASTVSLLVDRLQQRLWPAKTFVPLAQLERILPCKPTFEKDMLVKALFDEHPFLWEVLSLVSQDSMAFCQLERLSECLLAGTIGFWHVQTEQNPRLFGRELDQSCRLMELFRRVQFVPPILTFYGEIFDKIKCKDISKVLMNVWNFIKNNPPLPEQYGDAGRRSLESVPVDEYLDNAKAVLRENVVNLGENYSRFFHH